MQVANSSFEIQFHRWKTDFLVDYIVNIHHAYFRSVLPWIDSELKLLSSRYEEKRPLIKNLLDAYSSIEMLLRNEFQYQEERLFPYIKQIYSAYNKQASYGRLFVRTLRKPINVVSDDTSNLNAHLDRVRELSHDYRPFKSHADYNVVMSRLKEFDTQVVLHKHIEETILFPAAIDMEAELLKP